MKMTLLPAPRVLVSLAAWWFCPMVRAQLLGLLADLDFSLIYFSKLYKCSRGLKPIMNRRTTC